MKLKVFEDKQFFQKLIFLSLPIAFQNLMLASVAAADAIMLGSLDQNSMTAVSLATQFQFLQNMTVSGVTAAFMILAAQYWGKEDRYTCSKLFYMSLKICASVSALFCLCCVFVPKGLMTIYTNVPELIGIGTGYLRIAGFSYLLTGFSQCYLSLMKVSDQPSAAAKISSGAVILNILLNRIFIFGAFGIPAFGVRGAAMATLSARIIELLACLLAVRGRNAFAPQIKAFFARDAVLAKDFRKCLWPLLGAYLFWTIGFSSYSSFMGHLGANAAAASSVCAVVRELTGSFNKGLASGGGILVGNELGAGNLEKARVYGDRLVLCAIACGFGTALLILGAIPVTLIFIRLTAEAAGFFKLMMVIIAVATAFGSLNGTVINGIFASGGDTIYDLYSIAFSMWCFAIPLAALGTYVLGWPPVLVYMVTCADEFIKTPWTLAHYKKYKWVNDLTR